MIVLQYGEHKYVLPTLPNWCAVITPEYVTTTKEDPDDTLFLNLLTDLHTKGIIIGSA